MEKIKTSYNLIGKKYLNKNLFLMQKIKLNSVRKESIGEHEVRFSVERNYKTKPRVF